MRLVLHKLGCSVSGSTPCFYRGTHRQALIPQPNHHSALLQKRYQFIHSLLFPLPSKRVLYLHIVSYEDHRDWLRPQKEHRGVFKPSAQQLSNLKSLNSEALWGALGWYKRCPVSHRRLEGQALHLCVAPATTIMHVKLERTVEIRDKIPDVHRRGPRSPALWGHGAHCQAHSGRSRKTTENYTTLC